MKRILTSIFFILSAAILSVSAQSLAVRQNFEKGVSLANAGSFETALKDFEKSLALAEIERTNDDFRARIRFNIGVCLYRLKRNEKSIAEFEEAIKLTNGDYEKAFYALGMAEAELKNWRESEAAFLNAIRLNKRNGEAWFDLAFIYLANNDFDSARSAFQKSVELKSVAAPISHNNLGVILALGGDIDSAVKEFEAALKGSNGKFTIAARNLEFCKSLGENFNRELMAKLEYGK